MLSISRSQAAKGSSYVQVRQPFPFSFLGYDMLWASYWTEHWCVVHRVWLNWVSGQYSRLEICQANPRLTIIYHMRSPENRSENFLSQSLGTVVGISSSSYYDMLYHISVRVNQCSHLQSNQWSQYGHVKDPLIGVLSLDPEGPLSKLDIYILLDLRVAQFHHTKA